MSMSPNLAKPAHPGLASHEPFRASSLTSEDHLHVTCFSVQTLKRVVCPEVRLDGRRPTKPELAGSNPAGAIAAAVPQLEEGADSESVSCRFDPCQRHWRDDRVASRASRCTPTGRGRRFKIGWLRVRILPAALAWALGRERRARFTWVNREEFLSQRRKERQVQIQFHGCVR